MVGAKNTRTKILLGATALGCLVALILFYLWVYGRGKEGHFDSEARKLVSDDIPTRESTLAALFKAQRESGGEFNLKNKYELFRKIVQIKSANYVYRAVYFISKLPEDPKIVTFAEAALDREGPDSTVLVGSLTYLDKHRPKRFEEYFRSRKYSDIRGQLIGRTFASSHTVSMMRQEYYKQLVTDYVKWKPQPGTFDYPNPVRKKMLIEGRNIVPTIVSIYGKSRNAGLPLAIIWISGEIGAPEAFDLLVKEYLARPSERTAISLGSCLGSLSTKKLFDGVFKNENNLRKLLKSIYGSRWQEVKDLSIENIKDHLMNNLQEVRSDCKKRSIPILG